MSVSQTRRGRSYVGKAIVNILSLIFSYLLYWIWLVAGTDSLVVTFQIGSWWLFDPLIVQLYN